MTERQLLLLYGAEQRRRSRQRAEALIDVNLAFAGGKDAEAHMKNLTK